ncbi:MAG: helix-turn-helix domain-containing protein [Pseudobdellovibrionaceae bacterium]|nr:helix-turn-helix domain-containing protein [Pseudobdellovibrionaceae bacterium]
MSAVVRHAQDEAPTKIHRRDHSFALDRDKNYTVILRLFFILFKGPELLVLGYLLSLAPSEHPGEKTMATDLSMSVKKLQRALKSLKAKGVLFHDFVVVGVRRKAIWHVSHPSRWEGSGVPFKDSTDPRAHVPLVLLKPRRRINEAREFILANENDSMRLPNILFKVHLNWRAKLLYAWLCSQPEEVNPSISELASSLNFNWRTIRNAVKALDRLGMISIEKDRRDDFGSWIRLYHHLTDIHFWKFAAAKETYSAPKGSGLRGIRSERTEKRWQECRSAYEPLHSHAVSSTASCDSGVPISSAFEVNRLHFSSAEEVRGCGQTMPNGSAFGGNSSALQGNRTAEERIRTAESSTDTPLNALSSKGSISCNNTIVKNTVKESMEEGSEPADEQCAGSRFEAQEKRILSARIINIADSAAHVFVNSRGRKCDPGLWTETVDEVNAIGGESHARKFVRYVAEVFLARGRKPMGYNSMAMEDLRDGFLKGRNPVDVAGIEAGGAAAPKAAPECEILADTFHSSEMVPRGAQNFETTHVKESAPIHAMEPNFDSQVPRPQPTKAVDQLRDLPSEENRLRWLVHQMWPKLRKTQKTAFREAWTAAPGPESALRAFAARDGDCHLQVLAAAAELLKSGILPKALPMPWEAAGSEAAPSFVAPTRTEESTNQRAQVSGSGSGQQSIRNEAGPEFSRDRMNAAMSILTHVFKPNTRLSMEKGFARLTDANLWAGLCQTFTEVRLREVLRDIP